MFSSPLDSHLLGIFPQHTSATLFQRHTLGLAVIDSHTTSHTQASSVRNPGHSQTPFPNLRTPANSAHTPSESLQSQRHRRAPIFLHFGLPGSPQQEFPHLLPSQSPSATAMVNVLRFKLISLLASCLDLRSRMWREKNFTAMLTGLTLDF